VLSPQAVHAAGFKQYDVYIVKENQANSLSEILTRSAANGWEVVSVAALPDFTTNSNAVMVLLAR